MEQLASAPTAAGWRSAVGSVVGVAGSAACAVAVGWILAPHSKDLWGDPLVPWGVGLAFAGVLARVTPRAWADRWLAARERRAAAAALLAVFFAVQVAMAWLGYLTFRYYSSDLKLFVDLVQGSFRGQFIHWVQANPSHTESYLAHHWALQTLLWLPAWMVWPDPRTLFLIQIGGYVAMAAAVYRLAALRLGPGPWPLAIATAVLLVPSKDWALSAEMGNAPFLAFLIVAAVVCVRRGRPVAFVLALILILMSREDAGVFAVVLAIYAWWTAGWRRLGAAALVISAAWMVVLLKVVMPWFTTIYATRPPWGFYNWLGGSSSAALSDPGGTLGRVFGHLLDASLPSVLRVLTPFGLLPFMTSPAWVLLLGLVPALLTHGYPAMLTYHHSYPAIAVAAVMAIEGARAVDRRLSSRPRLRLAAVLAVPMTALLLHTVFGYSPLTRSFVWSDYWPTPHTCTLWAALRLVPPGATLAGSHRLSTHRYVGRRPGCTWEYVALRTVGDSPELWCERWNVPLDDPFVLIDRPRPSPELRHLLTASSYAVVFDHQDVALLRQGGDTSANRPLARWALGEVREATSLPRQIGSVLPDAMARQGRAVRAPRRQEGFVLYGWYVWACARPHELVVRLRGETPWQGGSLGSVELVADRGTRLLAARPLEQTALDRAEYRELVVAATLPEAGWIEGRIRSTGAAPFWVDALTLVSVSPSGAVEPPDESCGGAPETGFSPSSGSGSAPRAPGRTTSAQVR